MGFTILKVDISSEADLVELRQQTRQTAGLLCFPAREQAEIAAAATGAAGVALKSAARVKVVFEVDESAPAQVFKVTLRFEGDWPPGARRPAAGILDGFDVSASARGTTVTLRKTFPPGAPRVAGEALARIAGELARRSRPQSAHADAGVQMLMDTIHEKGRRSAALIDDLLALAEAGRVPADITDVAVNQVVERIIAERALLIEDRGVEVCVGEELGVLKAGATHIYQVFANLIGNAIKYCDASEPLVEVRRVEESPDGTATYVVRDNGSGISPDELDGIFTPFFRGSGGGTGVGLAIVEKIVRLYNGEIVAFNDDGACFEFTMMGIDG